MHQVKHNLSDKECCLLPFNLFLHAGLTEAITGEKLQFYDGTATLLKANAIPIRICKRLGRITHIISPLGHQISNWLYSIDLVKCYELWEANWGRIDCEKILFLTYEKPIKDENKD